MTSRRGFALPILDRLLQREVTVEVEVPGTVAYIYNELDTGGSGWVADGKWRRISDTELGIGLDDSNGVSFPRDLAIPADGVAVSWDGATPTILTVTALVILRTGFNFIPVGIQLTFDGELPEAGTVLTVEVDTGVPRITTVTVERPTWCARRDFLGRDLLGTITEGGGLVAITDSRFIVRAEGPATWDEGDTFTDDEGVKRTVRGVAQIGRGRFLELLARKVG